MGRKKSYTIYPPARAYEVAPQPKPLEYQLVDLLGEEGIGESEVEALRITLLFVAAKRKRDAIAAEESELAAMKHDLERSMSREHSYLSALMEISNSEGPMGEIASRTLFGSRLVSNGTAAAMAAGEQASRERGGATVGLRRCVALHKANSPASADRSPEGGGPEEGRHAKHESATAESGDAQPTPVSDPISNKGER